MAESNEDKLLPEMETGEIKTKSTRKALSGTHRLEMEDSDEVDSDTDSDVSSDSEYVCSLCSKKFSGYLPLKQHERSGKHAKAILKQKRKIKLLNKVTDSEKGTENEDEYLYFIKKPFAVCKPCGKQFGDEEAYHMHMISKKHKQREMQSKLLDQVRKDGEINVNMLKELYKNKTSARGKNRDITTDLIQDAEDKIASLHLKGEDEDVDIQSDEFECKDCEKSFSGLVPYTQHLISKVHTKTVEKKKALQKIIPEELEDSEQPSHSKHTDLSTLVMEDDILVCKLCSMAFSGPENAMMHLKSKGHKKELEKQMHKQERRKKGTGSHSVKRANKKHSNASAVEKIIDDETENNESKVDSKSLDEFVVSAATVTHDSHAEKEDNEEKKETESDNVHNEFLAYENYKKYKDIMFNINKKDEDS